MEWNGREFCNAVWRPLGKEGFDDLLAGKQPAALNLDKSTQRCLNSQ